MPCSAAWWRSQAERASPTIGGAVRKPVITPSSSVASSAATITSK